MKKSFSILIAFLMMFIFNVVSVNAVEKSTCTYGTKKGDKFEKVVQFTITSDGAVSLDFGNSPFLGSNASSSNWQSDYQSNSINDINVVGFYHTSSQSISVSTKLYDSIDTLKQIAEYTNKYCPRTIIYKHREKDCAGQGYSSHSKEVRFLASDMEDNDDDYKEDGLGEQFLTFITGCWKSNNGAFQKMILVEKDSQGTIDETECSTYDNHMFLIEMSKSKVKSNSCDGNYWFDKEYEKLQTLCSNFRETSYYTNQDDEGVTAKKCMSACSRFYDDIDRICGSSAPPQECHSLGEGVLDWIFKIIRFVRYGVPALLIILSVLDYIKALASDSDDEMKKVNSKFFKRLVAAALIFVVPFILEFVIGLFNLPGLDNLFCS